MPGGGHLCLVCSPVLLLGFTRTTEALGAPGSLLPGVDRSSVLTTSPAPTELDENRRLRAATWSPECWGSKHCGAPDTPECVSWQHLLCWRFYAGAGHHRCLVWSVHCAAHLAGFTSFYPQTTLEGGRHDGCCHSMEVWGNGASEMPPSREGSHMTRLALRAAALCSFQGAAGRSGEAHTHATWKARQVLRNRH